MSMEILLSGATGTTSRSLIELIEADPHFRISGRASRENFFEPDVEADVIIDFSHPELLEHTLSFAVRRHLPLIIGTTGIGPELDNRIVEAAEHIAICRAANFSLGVNLLERLVGQAARALGDGFDVEISELHHRRKIDAPSGTALALGAAVARARGQDIEINAVFDRSQQRRQRVSGEIGHQALRGGDVAGEHTVFFLGDGERLELTHRATDRGVFARGALLAAQCIVNCRAGLIDFYDLALGQASPNV
jgi:4-hydroxy-tetrahydrodipicolinate reductase